MYHYLVATYWAAFSIAIFINIQVFGQNTYQEKGLASYYHQKFHGRRTSSGERFNQNKYTGAHRKLLFNTIVRVTNLSNDKSVIIRINDRGPYKYSNRIIDLTYSAAKKIGMIESGVAKVKLEVVGSKEITINNTHPIYESSFQKDKTYNYKGEERNPVGYGIQVAAFAEALNAKYYAKQLFKEGYREIVIKVGSKQKDSLLYKVIVGEFKTKSQSLALIPKLKKKDFLGFPTKY